MKLLTRSLLVGIWFAVLCLPIILPQIQNQTIVALRYNALFLIFCFFAGITLLFGIVKAVFTPATKKHCTSLLTHWVTLFNSRLVKSFLLLLMLGISILPALFHCLDAFSTIESSSLFSTKLLLYLCLPVCAVGIWKVMGKQDSLEMQWIVAFLFILSILPLANLPLQHLTPLIRTLLYIILGLGLNIIVGLAGQLVLGYAAFYAIGAYSYALLYQFFGLSFWLAIPAGFAITTLCGLLIGFPVLRLRGDYLAIVTLGFGEIIRTLLINLDTITNGNEGISNIARPNLFFYDVPSAFSTQFMFYIALVATIITVLIVTRLTNSRIGRAWRALSEDEIATQSMGIHITWAKLSAFAISASFAGIAGVLLAGKDRFISPGSFTFPESTAILSIVVIGGMGSRLGVIIGAFVLILLPEYLRFLSENRMLAFGAIMVFMMVFRPQGIFPARARRYFPKTLALKKPEANPDSNKEAQ